MPAWDLYLNCQTLTRHSMQSQIVSTSLTAATLRTLCHYKRTEMNQGTHIHTYTTYTTGVLTDLPTTITLTGSSHISLLAQWFHCPASKTPGRVGFDFSSSSLCLPPTCLHTVHAASSFIPTDPYTILRPWSPSIDSSELRKVRRSADFQLRKL